MPGPYGFGAAIAAFKANGCKFCPELTRAFFEQVEELIFPPDSASERERKNVIRSARLLLNHPSVDINWVHQAVGGTVLMLFLDRGDHNHPFLRILLASRRIDSNTKSAKGWTALHFASLRHNSVFLPGLLQDGRFDVHALTDRGNSILDAAVSNECLQNVRIILEDGRVQPTKKTFHAVGLSCRGLCCELGGPRHVKAMKLALRSVGRRLRDDRQNARRVCNKMKAPKAVLDNMLPFLGQGIFTVDDVESVPELAPVCVGGRHVLSKTTRPMGPKIDAPDHVYRLEMLRDVKAFVDLFGNVHDFDWPDLSDELESHADDMGRLPMNFGEDGWEKKPDFMDTYTWSDEIESTC